MPVPDADPTTPEALIATADRIAAGLHDVADALRGRGQAPPGEAFERVSITEVMAVGPPSRLAVAAALVREAARVLDAIDAGEVPAEHLGSASQRLADTLMVLAAAAKASGLSGPLPGVDVPTRHGAQLDRRPPSQR